MVWIGNLGVHLSTHLDGAIEDARRDGVAFTDTQGWTAIASWTSCHCLAIHICLCSYGRIELHAIVRVTVNIHVVIIDAWISVRVDKVRVGWVAHSCLSHCFRTHHAYAAILESSAAH